MLAEKRLKAQFEVLLRNPGMRQLRLKKGLPEPSTRSAGREPLAHSRSKGPSCARKTAQMLGQHGLDIRLDLPSQDRRGAFRTDGHNNRVAVHYGGRNKVTLIGFIQHVDPGAGLPRPVCKLSINRFIFRSRVNQPHALEISCAAQPCLQRQSPLVRPLSHRLRRRLTK